MRRTLLIVAVLFAAAAAATAQTIAIMHARVYPVSGAPITNGTVVIRGGVIVSVGVNVPIPLDALRIDATGKVVTPGLINAQTELGVVEVSQVRDTNDVSAKGN